LQTPATSENTAICDAATSASTNVESAAEFIGPCLTWTIVAIRERAPSDPNCSSCVDQLVKPPVKASKLRPITTRTGVMNG
jgi:hypothetical protein